MQTKQGANVTNSNNAKVTTVLQHSNTQTLQQQVSAINAQIQAVKLANLQAINTLKAQQHAQTMQAKAQHKQAKQVTNLQAKLNKAQITANAKLAKIKLCCSIQYAINTKVQFYAYKQHTNLITAKVVNYSTLRNNYTAYICKCIKTNKLYIKAYNSIIVVK
jgi:hypothetical protein